MTGGKDSKLSTGQSARAAIKEVANEDTISPPPERAYSKTMKEKVVFKNNIAENSPARSEDSGTSS